MYPNTSLIDISHLSRSSNINTYFFISLNKDTIPLISMFLIPPNLILKMFSIVISAIFPVSSPNFFTFLLIFIFLSIIA